MLRRQAEQSRRTYLLFARKEVIHHMNNNPYYSYRIRLEKLKQKTWMLVVLARFLVVLALVVTYCLRQS
jgi:hypothetical protein